MDKLLEEIENLKLQNLQLRRANSSIKNGERHWKRMYRELKEKLEKDSPHKTKYRNKNHQGRRK